ncbi:MAG TPA: triose-phosphate isomerase [Cytophagales bacterium]|nr:triose-phosphate isomerase [Cytophagales bacterium]
MRKKIVAGNWKMNKDLKEGLQLASEVVNMAKDEVNTDAILVLCTPFIHLSSVSNLLTGQNKVFLGAQNCYTKASGAYTGEVSVSMLKSVNVAYVIIGHSERREYFKETNQQLADKVNIVLENNLKPIFCCGETLEERNSGKHIDIVKSQIAESLFHLSEEKIKEVVIAYEPVWAIGTGVTASSDQAQEMHKVIRDHLKGKFGAQVSENLSILYGGSCKPSNAKELFACPDIDGGLIGGASLVSRDFIDIAKSF